MKKLRVEFRYFDRESCSRCKVTDGNVAETIRNLRGALAEEGVKVELKTTKLPASRLGESNSVLVNGVDAEEIVSGKTSPRSTACRGCGSLINGRCDCRAYIYRGQKHRCIPKAMIREAIRKVMKIGPLPNSR